MKEVDQRILTINGGSSSIKFALFTIENDPHQILQGEIDRIGLSKTVFQVKESIDKISFSKSVNAPDYKTAVNILMDWIEQQDGQNNLKAVGHRVVHGGPKYSKPELINPAILKEMKKLSAFDPEHLPGEILLIKAFQERFPNLPQVACFDTAFHHEMPRVAKILPIPRHYEALGIHRYGFHGLSYEYLMEELSKQDGHKQERVILAHLGNGASLCAVREGKSIDTSMSFTPTAGIPMSTRSGDLDPGLAWYLASTEGLDPEKFNKMVNTQSGLLGISETSSDMRDLLDHEKTDVRAAEAVALFCYQVKKWIGGFAAALGGIETLVFAGGIGENASPVRQRICEGLEFLGIEIEEKRNSKNEPIISTANSKVTVRVIHTDEALMIAKKVFQYKNIKLH